MFGKCGGGGRRTAARRATPLLAVYTTVTRSHSAELVDISCTGARLSGDHLPEDGEEVLLSVGPLRAFGAVVWAEAGACGITFEPQLAPAEVGKVAAVAAGGRGLAVEFRTAMDHWTEGFAR